MARTPKDLQRNIRLELLCAMKDGKEYTAAEIAARIERDLRPKQVGCFLRELRAMGLVAYTPRSKNVGFWKYVARA